MARTIKEPEYENTPWAAIIFTAIIIIVLLMSGCSTTKYVPVTTTETITQIVHDTLTTHDTLTNNTTTIIRELDSLQMAQYGITLANKEHAWLVDRQQLQQQISTLQQSHAEAVHDTITKPVPYEVEKKVPAELSKWQSFRIMLGNILLSAFGCGLLYLIYYIYRKFKP